MTSDLGFLWKAFLRRFHIFLLVSLPIAVVGAFLAYALPAMYTAEARLLVESPQVPQELAASTMRQGSVEVLQVIEQRVLARANMLDLSREYRLHADQPGISPDAIVTDMRRRIDLRLPRGRDATVVTVSFDAARPEVSAAVANALVTQILRENVALRTTVATQTLAFFDEEVSRLADDMSAQTNRILSFKEANREALPDNLSFRQARQASLQERLLQIDRELSSLRDRRERLITVFERTGRIEGAAEAMNPDQRQLQQLRNDLSRALVIYSPENPRIRTLQAQITALEEVVAAQFGTDATSLTGSTALDLQLTDIDAQTEFLAAQKAMTEQELASLLTTLEATPANAVALEALERDYENLQTQYNQAVARRAQARMGERIEAQSRGHRITVIEQAVPPELPTKPNRRAIAMAGIGGGLALGIAVTLLTVLMNRTVQRPAEITQRLGFAPFAAVPYFRNRRETYMRRALVGTAVMLIAVGIPGGLWYVDQYYLPLDLVMARITERTGLDMLLDALRGTG